MRTVLRGLFNRHDWYPDEEDYLDRGVAFFQQGRHAEAIEAYRKALGLNSFYILSNNNLGLALAARENYDDAIAAFQEALQLDPGHTDARYNLAVAYTHRGRWTDAGRELQEVLRIAPEHPAARTALEILSTDGDQTAEDETRGKAHE